jgi:uncharacterized protein (TIGR03067 family)
MNLILWVPLVLGVLSADDSAKQGDVKKELQQLEGTWVVVSEEMDGRKVPADTIKPSKLIVKGDTYTVQMGERVVEKGTIQIDPTKKPKTIDATPSDGENKGKTFHGIYEIQGDTAKDCFAMDGKERPKEFATKQGSGMVVRVYKRDKR